MSLKVSAVNKTSTGIFIDVSIVLDLEKPAKMLGWGVALILERPYDRDFPVITNEIFCEDQFEDESYSRSRSVNISPRIFPSIYQE